MKTRWSRPVVWGFERTFRPWMRWRLSGIYLAGLPENLPAGGKVLLVANHTSWWDGFLLREIHRRCAPPGIPLATLMREDELRRFPFFYWMGVTGLDSSPGGIRSSLRSLERLRKDHGGLWVSFFPEGRIGPAWKRPLVWSRGLEWYARFLSPVTVIPVAIHLEAGNRPAPAAFVLAGEPFSIEPDTPAEQPGRAERAVTDVLDQLQGFLSLHAEAAPTAWPGFKPFPAPPDPLSF